MSEQYPGFSDTRVIHTVAPGYGDAFKEDQEEQTHSAGGIVVKQFEHVNPSLVAEKWSWGHVSMISHNNSLGGGKSCLLYLRDV